MVTTATEETPAAVLSPPRAGWDYDTHTGDCCPRVEGGVWTVCCRACAGTGVFPVPWCLTVEAARGRDDATCVACKATGRAMVVLAAVDECASGVDGRG